jgi:5-(carboxyamino)imidazole ribonucleotide synthase
MTVKIGILGAGQLGMMLGSAGLPLEIHCVFLDPNPLSPARLVGKHICDDFCTRAVNALAEEVEVITFEFENIPYEAIVGLDRTILVHPSLNAIKVSQDRLLEKLLFEELAIPTTRYVSIDELDELKNAFLKFEFGAVLKTRRLGYDGKGQIVIKQWTNETPLDAKNIVYQQAILEELITFDYEVSCIGVFSEHESAFYPLNLNTHHNGVLLHTKPIEGHPLFAQAKVYVEKIAKKLGYQGVLTVEFFVKDGKLIANEIAPRVHNSGHWTIEGAHCSQFENHLRAICNLPLGETTLLNSSVEMWNILSVLPNKKRLLEVPGLHLHIYGKEPQAGRKLGHVTVTKKTDADISSLFLSET